MKWSKETIISLIIVLLFVGSIFGMAIGSGDRSSINNNTTDTNTVTNPDENKPTEFFTAYIDSNVLDLYPQIIVVGTTTVYDESTIDTRLKQISGVKKNTISFQRGTDQNIITMIKILIDADKKTEIIASIDKIEFLSTPGVYQSALLSMPKGKITLSGDNNTTKEYEFTDSKVDGMVGTLTEKGDELKAQIQIIFQGETPIRFLAIESQNLSTNTQIMMTTKNIAIKEWNSEIRFYANSPITKEFDENEMKIILGDENIGFGRSVEGSLSFILKDNNMFLDVNTYLSEIRDENESVISNLTLDENLGTIEFKETLKLDKYNLIKSKLLEFGVNNTKITSEPSNIYRIDYSKDQIDLDLIKSKLVAGGLVFKEAEKNATFDVSQVEYQGKIYAYDANTTTAWLLYPSDLNKTSVDLILQGYYSRNKLWYITLQEKRE